MCAFYYKVVLQTVAKTKKLINIRFKTKRALQKSNTTKDGVLFELLIYIFCQRDDDLKPLLHTVTAFPVSAGERGVCPKACRCIYSLHLTGGTLVELRVWLQTEFTLPRRGRVEGVVWNWA